MLTKSTAATLAYAAAHRASHAKVEVYSTVESAWIDLSARAGYDWIRSVEIRESVDDATAKATVELFPFAGQGDVSCSPFVNGGLFNFASGVYVAYGQLLLPYKKIRISLAVTATDAAPATGDYVLSFTGRIASVEVSDKAVTLQCEDHFADLQSLFVETTEVTYARNAGVNDALEDVIQALLDDWDNGLGVTLWSVNGTLMTPFNAGDSPAWNLLPTKSDRIPVADAIRRLVDMIGWDIRYRYLSAASDRVLVLSEPDRAKAAADATFAMSQILDFRATMSLGAIRNAVVVGYYAGVKTIRKSYPADPASAPTTADGTTSVTNFGRRYFELNEEASSEIDTATEATAMAQAIEKDLALPDAQVSLTVPLYPHLELQDGVGITGDNLLISTRTILGVDAIIHRVDASGGQTSLLLRGKPASRRNWVSGQRPATRARQSTENQKSGSIEPQSNLVPNGSFGSFKG